eukprot:5532398-Prymnesium_polylepis.1
MFYGPILRAPVRSYVRVEGWKRLQRLKLAWQARLVQACVACKFGRTVSPCHACMWRVLHGPRFAGLNRGASRGVYE